MLTVIYRNNAIYDRLFLSHIMCKNMWAMYMEFKSCSSLVVASYPGSEATPVHKGKITMTRRTHTAISWLLNWLFRLTHQRETSILQMNISKACVLSPPHLHVSVVTVQSKRDDVYENCFLVTCMLRCIVQYTPYTCWCHGSDCQRRCAQQWTATIGSIRGKKESQQAVAAPHQEDPMLQFLNPRDSITVYSACALRQFPRNIDLDNCNIT